MGVCVKIVVLLYTRRHGRITKKRFHCLNYLKIVSEEVCMCAAWCAITHKRGVFRAICLVA